jgi:hypothetical protein
MDPPLSSFTGRDHQSQSVEWSTMSFSTFSLLQIQGGAGLMGGRSSSRSSLIWAPLMLTKWWHRRRPRPLGGVTWSKVVTNHKIEQQPWWNSGGHTTVQMMKMIKTLMAMVGVLLPHRGGASSSASVGRLIKLVKRSLAKDGTRRGLQAGWAPPWKRSVHEPNCPPV